MRRWATPERATTAPPRLASVRLTQPRAKRYSDRVANIGRIGLKHLSWVGRMRA
jgi:hypothetical protein